MVLPQFEYLAPKTIGEACNLFLELGSTARVMAGATDLIPPMKDKVISPEYIIDLKKIPGLDYLEYDDREGLKIGALTTLRTIETSPLVKEKNPAVAHAAKVVASTQIRTKGTMQAISAMRPHPAIQPPTYWLRERRYWYRVPTRTGLFKSKTFSWVSKRLPWSREKS